MLLHLFLNIALQSSIDPNTFNNYLVFGLWCYGRHRPDIYYKFGRAAAKPAARYSANGTIITG